MAQSKLIEQKHKEAALLLKRLTPEERLVAFFRHSQLVYQLYQAGVRYRAQRKRKRAASIC